METNRFDLITKTFADRRSRRSALKGGAISLGAALFGSGFGHSAAAQDATPETGDATGNGSFLFVQTAASGSFTPNPGAGTPTTDGTPVPGGGAQYLLTLDGHPGGTVYFSDRPERIFGDAPTRQFLDGLGFSPANPPNAALVAQTDAGEDVLVLELLNPSYDAAAGTLIYGANVLSQYAGEGLAHVAARQRDDTIAPQFGRASLFIDDCPAQNPLECYSDCSTTQGNLGNQGMCWSWSAIQCVPCHGGGWSGTAATCNATFPSCDGKCFTNYGANCSMGPP